MIKFNLIILLLVSISFDEVSAASPPKTSPANKPNYYDYWYNWFYYDYDYYDYGHKNVTSKFKKLSELS